MNNLRSIAIVMRDYIQDLSVRVWNRVLAGYKTCSEVSKHGIKIIKGQLTINGSMAFHGSLFFFISIILLAVKQGSEISIWGSIPILKLIPSPPINFPTVLRIILFIISFIFVAAVPKIKIWKARKFANFLEGRLKIVAHLIMCLLLLFALWIIPPMLLVAQIIPLVISVIFIIAVFCRRLGNKLEELLKGPLNAFYWVFFLFAYVNGWTKSLSSVPSDSFASPLVVYLGFFWFVVITIVWYKAIAQSGKK